MTRTELVKTLEPRQNDQQFAKDISKSISLKETVSIFSMKLVSKGSIANKSSLVQVMAWH